MWMKVKCSWTLGVCLKGRLFSEALEIRLQMDDNSGAHRTNEKKFDIVVWHALGNQQQLQEKNNIICNCTMSGVRESPDIMRVVGVWGSDMRRKDFLSTYSHGHLRLFLLRNHPVFLVNHAIYQNPVRSELVFFVVFVRHLLVWSGLVWSSPHSHLHTSLSQLNLSNIVCKRCTSGCHN